MEAPEQKRRMRALDAARALEISRVTWVGFWVNVVLSVVKIGAGFLGNSRAVLADGVHTLSDLITDIAVLVGVRFWIHPPDEAHPYGHKRLESLVALTIGVLLAVAGVGIAIDAVDRMGEQGDAKVGSLLALFAALFSIVSKEALYRWTAAKAREIKSEAVRANAWDHRSDAISSIPIALAVAVALWFPAFAVVDLIGALVVSVFILHAAWKICQPAANVLLDKGADAEVRERILRVAAKVPGVKGAHDLRTRYLGQGLQVDLHVSVDGSLTVAEGNVIAHALEDTLYSEEAAEAIGVEICDVLVHIDPWLPDATNVR